MNISKRKVGGAAACLASLLVLIVAPAQGAARPGSLDRGFGDGGRAAIPTGRTVDRDDAGRVSQPHLDIAPDGSVAVARGNLVLRFLPNGHLDNRFGDQGRLWIPSVEGLPFKLADVAVGDEGKVWVFGAVVDPSIVREIPGYYPARVSPSFAVVLRLGPTGAPDTSFAGGDGVVRYGLDLGPEAGRSGIPLVQVESAELDSSGRVVMAVDWLGIPPSEGHGHYGWVTDALVRLTQSGQLDPTFGGNGVVGGLLGPSQVFEDFCLTPAGDPVIAVYEFMPQSWLEKGNPPVAVLTRLQHDGSLDRGFGDGGSKSVRGDAGLLACDRFGGLAMLRKFETPRPDGTTYPKVVRLSPGGRVDHRFGRRATKAVSSFPDVNAG